MREGQQFGQYSPIKRLACGGMAEILLARRVGERDAPPVVLKKILAHFAQDEEFVEMFLDEARIGLSLRHEHICGFLDSGDVGGHLYIAMEWVNGITLGRVIRRARKFGGIPLPMACEIIAKVADALHHAHTARNAEGEIMGLIHRDVSPHNVMLGYDGAVKLLDFGIAKAQIQSHHTQAGVVKGKFAYMAPEQCRGRPVDFKIDIFALGVVLVETLTGKSLYRRESEAATMRSIIEDPVPMLSERLENPPRELEAIVQAALAKDKAERFPTAAAMRDVLRMFVKRSSRDVSQHRTAAMVQHYFEQDLVKGPSVDSSPFGSSYNIQVSGLRSAPPEEPRPTLAPGKPRATEEPKPAPEVGPQEQEDRRAALRDEIRATLDELNEPEKEEGTEINLGLGFDAPELEGLLVPAPDLGPKRPKERQSQNPTRVGAGKSGIQEMAVAPASPAEPIESLDIEVEEPIEQPKGAGATKAIVALLALVAIALGVAFGLGYLP